jgi:hypothetical protein
MENPRRTAQGAHGPKRVGQCADSGGVDELDMTQIDDQVNTAPKNASDDLAKAHGGPLIEFACRRAPNTPGRRGLDLDHVCVLLGGPEGSARGLGASPTLVELCPQYLEARLVHHAMPLPRL